MRMQNRSAPSLVVLQQGMVSVPPGIHIPATGDKKGCIFPCSGASMGGGVKLGAVRFEYATDQNQGTSNIFVRFGERF